MEKVRIGMVGCGTIAALSHLPAMEAVPEAECVAIFDVDQYRVVELGKNRNVKIFDSYEKMLDSGIVDAVVVASPNIFHKEQVCQAVVKGIHVLCEKPMATILPDAAQILKYNKKHNIILQVGFNQRYWNQVKLAKRIVDEGIIGQVMGFRSTYRESWDVYPAATEYRYDLKQSGGACIIDLAIHRIDLARYLVGEITEICADIKHSVIPPEVDDNVWLMCKFGNGATGSICSDRYSPVVSNATELYGSDGTLFLSTETINPFQSAPLALYSRKLLKDLPEFIRHYHYPFAWWEQPDHDWICVYPPRENPYVSQMKEFCNCILTGKQPLISAEDGYKAVEIVTAAYLSSQEKRWVTLPLI